VCSSLAELDTAALSAEQKNIRRKTHETIKKVTDDFSRRHTFNTAVAAVMELMNDLNKFSDDTDQGLAVAREAIEAIVLLLSRIRILKLSDYELQRGWLPKPCVHLILWYALLPRLEGYSQYQLHPQVS